MSFLVANATNAPAIWVKGNSKSQATSRIMYCHMILITFDDEDPILLFLACFCR